MPAKRQNAKGIKRPKKPAPKIDWPGHWLKLAGDPERAVPTDTCPEKVLRCIRKQSSADLSNNPQIGKINVDGGRLARCINDTFGTSYTKDDFPPTDTVLDCIKTVCGSTAVP